jgi:uncharacterized protein YyaL (SSP411 family)
MAENQLGRETSPYLLQHKDNPVHWWAWSKAALAEAEAQNKPILLSIGYAACHWCHVMAHESFENPDIAALMNRLYVSIKVDREERPDLDAIYQQALMLLGEQGGWPLTMFLTPRGEPFWGGTYFPPAARWGRPGFPEVLQGIARIHELEPTKVTGNVAALAQGLAKLSQPQPAGSVTSTDLDPLVERFVRAIDHRYGGIGQAPKFPHCSILALIWRRAQRQGHRQWRDAVLLSLDAMCQGGIYDHLGGGFARYSTDERWLVPHFEKMLYDNAQLIELLTEAWLGTGEPLYRRRIEETIAWLLREMDAPEGGFAATFDADSEHEEGKFYVWSEAEVDQLLGAESVLFKTHYDVTPEGNWEGKTILNRLAAPMLPDPETEARLTECRKILFQTRTARVPPDRDDKVLADWNGLAIAALTQAAMVFDRADWLDAAETAFDFVASRMTTGDSRLHHSWRGGRVHPGTLDDYANMARAALFLYQATDKYTYLSVALSWTAVLARHFAGADGAYYFTADDTETLITRTRTAADTAVPAGNGTMIEVLARLFFLTGEAAYRDHAEQLIAAFSGELDRNFFPLSTYLLGVDYLAEATQLAIVGDPATPRTASLLKIARKAGMASICLQRVAPGTALPPGHPAHGKIGSGDAAAYLCRNQTCSLPITDPETLAQSLLPTHPSPAEFRQ